MSKFKQLSKVMWGRMRGKTPDEIARELMKDPEMQNMMQKIKIGLKIGKISQQDLMGIQQKVTRNPKEAQRELDELMKKLES